MYLIQQLLNSVTLPLRGVATFSKGLPLPMDTIRQVWGEGVRAGMYPISDTEV